MAIAAVLASGGICLAQSSGGAGVSIELVDPKVLRVCADPHNLPFSNDKGEGFENKLGELFAEKLQKKLDYMLLSASDRVRPDDACRTSLRRHHGISARRRHGPGHQPLLPDGVRAGRQAWQRP